MGLGNSFDTSKINSLFAEVQKMINCDPECQQKREAEKLRLRYEFSKANLSSAPANVEATHKNYVTFTEGESAWNSLYEKQLKEEVEKKANDFKNKQDEMKKQIQRQLGSYGGVLLNYKNIVELYLKYKKENAELVKDLKNSSNDVLTNERKTYYQDQQSDVLKFYYYYIILLIYVICVIFFGVISFIFPSQISWKIRLGVFILLILLPFISTRLLGIFIYIINEIYNMLPKNIYKENIDDNLGINRIRNHSFITPF
jgi:hypothetical protein